MTIRAKRYLNGWFLFLSFLFFLLLVPFKELNGGIRGLPEGKPRIEVGDKAPLELDELKNAHKQGKVILLMFGNPSHCIYCEKVWMSVNNLKARYEGDVEGILVIHRAAKFWAPESEAEALGKRYGVYGEPWLFLIDREGIVRHIFPGLIPETQIEKELKKFLNFRGKDG